MAKKAKKPLILVVASKVKQYAKADGGMRIGTDAILALSAAVAKLVVDAGSRARADHRQTIKDRDFI
jgi:hypothetical protein